MGEATTTVAAAVRAVMNASMLSGCHSSNAPSTLAATMITRTPIRTSLAVGGRAAANPVGRVGEKHS
jgi:hypothetical protein